MKPICANYIGFKQNAAFNPNAGIVPMSKPDDFEKVQEFRHQREVMSKECAYATRATAMAQVLMGNNLKFTTTPDEYVAQLTKQGKIPDKHFYIVDSKTSTGVVELNSDGEKTKEVTFFKGYDNLPPWVGCKFYNPKTQNEYKSIEYHQDGGVQISNGNPITGAPTNIQMYRPDGSLEYNRDIEKDSETHISKGGKLTTYKLHNEANDRIDRYFDDYGNKIYEKPRE